jgi:hypothetical protein
MHRLLWIRPDATTAERETLMRTLVEMDDDDTDGSEETKEAEEPNETKDPLWTWTRERGYESCPPHKGDLDVPDEERVASDSNLRPHDSTSAQAERVSVNGVIAALRTHLPWPVGVAGDRLGAGGGSLACTQALHVLRAMFEDLGVIEAQRKYGRAGEGGKTEALWPQLRGDQLGDLVTQLAVVIEVLGQPAKTVQKKDKDKDKDRTRTGPVLGRRRMGKTTRAGRRLTAFGSPKRTNPKKFLHPGSTSRLILRNRAAAGTRGAPSFPRKASATARSAPPSASSTRSAPTPCSSTSSTAIRAYTTSSGR